MNSIDVDIDCYSYLKAFPIGMAHSFKFRIISQQDFVRLMEKEEYFLILIDDKNIAKEFLQSAKNFKNNKFFRVIITDKEFTTDEVLYFLNEHTVLKILTHSSQSLDIAIEQCLKELKHLQASGNIINKVRLQNKALSEINDNLEDIVRQRTENLEKSKSTVESTLRGIKDLIKFIKNLSQINNFDDFIILLRQEFLKFHKIRSPLLIYSLGGSELRCIFFQGPQIIDQILSGASESFFSLDSTIVREALANSLGRPFGPILVQQFIFNENKGSLVFEHSFSDDEQKLFHQILDERAESLRVAFERLTLKWRSHLISRQWSSTFDLLKDPILIVDRDFKVVRSNKSFSQNQGEFCYQVFANRNEPCVGCPAIKSMSRTMSSASKINVLEKTYDAEAFPIVVEAQLEPTNFIVYYKDVTGSVNLQGQLVQSEKMAAIGMLAGNIAHELNNPLTGIKSLSQILLAELPPESSVYADLTEVKNASERCEQIIKNLLDFSSGKANDFIHCSLQAVFTKTLPLLKTALYQFNCNIQWSSLEDTVFVDPQLLQQVIFNLINNSCQAMQSQGSLFVTTEVDSKNVRLRIRDTGPGVPLHLRGEIFAPFFTTKEEGKGTGLGLSVSRAIVEKFGGALFLNEDVVAGCEFVIELPRSAV